MNAKRPYTLIRVQRSEHLSTLSQLEIDDIGLTHSHLPGAWEMTVNWQRRWPQRLHISGRNQIAADRVLSLSHQATESP